MKKYTYLLMTMMVIVSIIAPVNRVSADDVDKAKASKVGAYFLSAQYGDKSISAQSLNQVYEIRNAVRDIPAIYVFNTADNRGCVIVSGSDCMDPIIGYSTDEPFNPNNIPDNLKWWLEGYANYITYAQNNDVQPTMDNIASWKQLTDENLPYFGNQSKDGIITLLNTSWDQGEYYNRFSPKLNGTRCWAGCVATAFGQVLKYWSYPRKAQGIKSYRWVKGNKWLRINYDTSYYNYDIMPDHLDDTNTDEQINAVARLLYHAGVSVEMDFGADGSSASTAKVVDAINTYFKYEEGSEFIWRDNDSRFSNTTGVINAKDSAWVDLIRQNLLLKRPVIYRATDVSSTGRDAGHAFVCDGYNSATDKFRFNWGWNGTGNKLWFNVYARIFNVSAAGYRFSDHHAMLSGMTPPLDSIPPHLRPGTTGIENANADPFTASLYPNPATSQITVSFNLPSESSSELQVIDINGRVVKSITVTPSSTQTIISVDDLYPGIYFCRLQGYTKKFIVLGNN